MADTFINICSVGEQAGAFFAPVQRSTKVEKFYGKMKLFQDQIQRIVDMDERLPTGSDVCHVLKHFEDTLLGWMKESQNYFDEETRQFTCNQEYPTVDFNLLCTILLNALKEAKHVLIDNQEYVNGILRVLAYLVPFLPHHSLLPLPAKIASSITYLPTPTHAKAIGLICGYLLPMLLGAIPSECSKEHGHIGLSSPSLLLSIFQSCTDQSLYLRIVETLMTYTRNVCGDLLYVMAYGTPDVLEPAIHMLNRYYPAVDIGTVGEYRSAKQDSIIVQRCEYHSCADGSPDRFLRSADLLCIDPSICAAVSDNSPPLFLCTTCAEFLNQRRSSLFVDIVRSIGNIAEQCENPECGSESTSKAGMHFCFSVECTRKNRRKPMRLCKSCHESLHGKDGSYEDHIVHSSLFDVWSMKKPTQTYMVDTIARLLKEAHPPYRERSVEMGIDLDTVAAIDDADKRDANYYKKITRSLHGLSLLKALSPIPPSSYDYERMYSLLSMLFAWLETVSCKSHIHLKIVEIVERYQAQAVDWIKKVERYDLDLYCDCLLPLPPVQARIGLAWDSLMSENRQLLEGLQRLSVLVRFGLVSEQVWERVLPFWMQELKEKVTPDELPKFKVILRRIFDTGSDVTPSYSLNFIERKLQNVINTQRQEGLIWIQMLSAVDICLDVEALICIFLESTKLAEISDDEGATTMFQFPDPQSYRDTPKSPGFSAPSSAANSPFSSFSAINVVNNSLTYYILMMDILIKQVSIRKSTTNTSLNSQEAFRLSKLLVTIADRQKEGKHGVHSAQTTCQYCQLMGIFYYQITFLLDFILPNDSDLELRLKGGIASRTGSTKSSILSKISSNNGVAEVKVLRRMDSINSEPDFEETAPSYAGHVSSTGVDESDGEVSGGGSFISEESEQDSLLAWRNRIKGISEGHLSIASSMRMGPETNNWSAVYNANPEIELTVLLLQHIFKHNDAAVLCHILKSITMTCVRGECLRVSAREDMDLTHYLQTVLFIPSLWEMLQSGNSCLAQQAVPLLLHCVCMPYGAGRLCDEIENVFNNEDWMKRFAAVEKVTLLCQFLSVDIIRDSSLAKSTLVHGFVYLISAIDDVHSAVAARARTMVTSINKKSLKRLYGYMEEHFKRESSDRLMLLHASRSLYLVLGDTSPLSTKYFANLLCYILTKTKGSHASSSRSSSLSSTQSETDSFYANTSPLSTKYFANLLCYILTKTKGSHASSSRSSSLSSTQSETDSFYASPHIPIWSRALSSPGRATGIANWLHSGANNGNIGINRPRSASAPLVLYKQKYTLQFDRQTSLLSEMVDEDTEAEKSTLQRKRRMWTPGYDPFNKGKSPDASLLGGRIEGGNDPLPEEEFGARKESIASSKTSASSSKSTSPLDVDNVVLHCLITMLMEYLSDDKSVNAERTSLEDIKELKSTLVSCLVALTSGNEEDLVFKARELMQCTVFLSFLFNVTAVLDRNPYAGKEFLPLTLKLMLQCVGDEKPDCENAMTLDGLDPAMQHVWLMNLLVILYKYEFGEFKTCILQLISVVMNSINSHQHYLCINAPKKDATWLRETPSKSFTKRLRGRRAAMQAKRREKSKVMEEGQLKSFNGDLMDMSRFDSRNESRVTETSFIDSSQAETPTSVEDGRSFRIDSDSVASYEDETSLQAVFSSHKCPDCDCTLSEYEEENINLCIVVLSTFVHRDPEMAASELIEMLCVVSRKAFSSAVADDTTCSFPEPCSTMSIAKQFIRCIFVQLAPNGLFPELFRSEILDKEFFKAVVSSLTDFDMLDELAPLTSVLQDFSSRSNDRVMILLQNIDIYLQYLPKEDLGAWESILHHFESFFKALPSVLPITLELNSVLKIMTVLLSIGKHYAKSLLPSFGNIIAHTIRKCDFNTEALHKVCYACTCAFSKEREKYFLARAILQDLSLTIKSKISTHERNVKRIIQLIYLDGDSWFCFDSGDSDVKHEIPRLNIGLMHCLQTYQQELIDFIKHWNYRIKDMKDIDEESLNENNFLVRVKASLSQVVSLYLSSNQVKSIKASTRIFAWLRNPPTQLGRIDMILDSVMNLRLFSWLLLGALNHVVDCPESHDVIHFMSLAENMHLIEYVRIVLQSLVRQDAENNLRSLRPALYVTFIACQLWTVYCESHVIFHTNTEADPIATVMEFWTQITLTIVQLLNETDKIKLEVLLPFMKIMDGVAKCGGFAFPRLSTLWCPLIQFYKNEIPEDLYMSFKELQRYHEKSENPRNELQDLIKSTRFRLARLEKASHRFDHSVIV